MLEPEPVPKRLLLAEAETEVVGEGLPAGSDKVPEAEVGGLRSGADK